MAQFGWDVLFREAEHEDDSEDILRGGLFCSKQRACQDKDKYTGHKPAKNETVLNGPFEVKLLHCLDVM